MRSGTIDPPEPSRPEGYDVWPDLQGVGAAGTLNEVDWRSGERRAPWRVSAGFAPTDGQRRVVLAQAGYRPRGPR